MQINKIGLNWPLIDMPDNSADLGFKVKLVRCNNCHAKLLIEKDIDVSQFNYCGSCVDKVINQRHANNK